MVKSVPGSMRSNIYLSVKEQQQQQNTPLGICEISEYPNHVYFTFCFK